MIEKALLAVSDGGGGTVDGGDASRTDKPGPVVELEAGSLSRKSSNASGGAVQG